MDQGIVYGLETQPSQTSIVPRIFRTSCQFTGLGKKRSDYREKTATMRPDIRYSRFSSRDVCFAKN